MDLKAYWKLVDQAHDEAADGSADAIAEALVEVLAQLPAEQIAQAGVLYEELFNQAYRYDIWGGAHLLINGANEEEFEHFRGWLIMQGEEPFNDALEDPDSLADWVDEDDYSNVLCEYASSVADKAYKQATGERMPDPSVEGPDNPPDEAFDFDDDSIMQARYPRLFELVNE